MTEPTATPTTSATEVVAQLASVLSIISTTTTVLQTVNELLPKAEAAFSVVWGLFVDATPEMSNSERIATLRAKGIVISSNALAFLTAHGVTIETEE